MCHKEQKLMKGWHFQFVIALDNVNLLILQLSTTKYNGMTVITWVFSVAFCKMAPAFRVGQLGRPSHLYRGKLSTLIPIHKETLRFDE
jgi:hypothetical protein